MLTLAQRVAMDHLPSGPAFEVWLYERPVPTIIALVALGIVGAYVLRQRGAAKWWGAPLIGAVVLSAGVFSLASAVETGREAMERGTREWLEAMTTGDRAGARSLLNADVILSAAGTAYPVDVDALAGMSLQAAQLITSYNLRTVSSSQDGANVGRTRFEVTLGADGTPIPMGWELGWRRSGGSWTIVRAECLHVMNTAPQNNFRQWVPRLGRR